MLSILGELEGCGGRINTTSGAVNIRSPDADNDGKYDQFLDCQWLVVGPDFQIIDLAFTSFTLEGQQRRGRPTGGETTATSDDICPFDYVEVRQSHTVMVLGFPTKI